MNCEERCEDRHASACLVCGDGGDLLCCDACPNAVHPTCVSLETVPEVRQARTSRSYGQTSRPCCPYIPACCHVSCSECSVARASGNLAEVLPFQPSCGPGFGEGRGRSEDMERPTLPILARCTCRANGSARHVWSAVTSQR